MYDLVFLSYLNNISICLILSITDGNLSDSTVMSSDWRVCIFAGTAHVVGRMKNFIKNKYVKEKIIDDMCNIIMTCSDKWLRQDRLNVEGGDEFFYSKSTNIFKSVKKKNDKKAKVCV